MKIKRFDENIEEIQRTGGEEYLESPSVFATSVFNDIEGDLVDMGDDEQQDYLMSIIAFCNQHLKSLEQNG